MAACELQNIFLIPAIFHHQFWQQTWNRNSVLKLNANINVNSPDVLKSHRIIKLYFLVYFPPSFFFFFLGLLSSSRMTSSAIRILFVFDSSWTSSVEGR